MNELKTKPAPQKRILIVDDSKLVRTMIKKSLQPLDLEFYEAANGMDAMDMIFDVDPHLVTVDVEMPGINGFELCEQIRNIPPERLIGLAETPIIMITGTTDHRTREKGFQVGATEFINKPFTEIELLRRTKAILEPEQNLSTLTMLTVDDSSMVRKIVRNSLLQTGVNIVEAENGQVALDILSDPSQQIDLLLTDWEMPVMNGLELVNNVRTTLKNLKIPIIMLTSVTSQENIIIAFKSGVNDYLTKPFIKEEIIARLTTHLEQCWQIKQTQLHLSELEHKVIERNKKLWETQEATINVIAALVENRDPETGLHIINTQQYVALLAEKVIKLPEYRNTLNPEWSSLVTKCAPLHDIGKVGVSDAILLKPGKLTDKEFDEMKKHTLYGEYALKKAMKELGDSNYLDIAVEIIGSHHEKWDGGGYPRGLQGENIPLSGRIMAIADVYDALVSKRPYKDPMPHEKACQIIMEGRGGHFDPQLVEIFMEYQEKFNGINLNLKD